MQHPESESNVKEIFDKSWELKQKPEVMVFNQFEEMGNALWHYNVTGYALADVFEDMKKPGDRFCRSLLYFRICRNNECGRLP